MDIQDFIIQYFLKQKKNNNIKIRLFRIAFILLLLLIICFENHKTFLNYKNYIETKSFKELFNSNIKKHSILIFEPNKYHHECSPGFSKYFIDLGYNVDLLIHRNGIDSFYLFDGTKNIRLFIFKNLKHIQRKTKKLSRIMKKYDFVLVQSTDQKRKDLYINLKFLKRNNDFGYFIPIINIIILYLCFMKLLLLKEFIASILMEIEFGHLVICQKESKLIHIILEI